MKLLAKFAAIFDRTNDLLAVLASILLIFIGVTVTADVVLRKFLNAPLRWSVEINGYNLLFITFLATAWVLGKGKHVKVELVLSWLSPRVQSLLGIITSAIGVIICLVVAWYGVRVTWGDFQLGAFHPGIMKIPRAYTLFIIPVGGFLLSIQFLRRTYGFLREWRAF